MALNWTMLSADRSPVPLPHEATITTIETGADLTVIVPDAPPSGSASSGGSGGNRIFKETGRLWLTDQRVRSICCPSAHH
jgi:WW domain-binding protein 2